MKTYKAILLAVFGLVVVVGGAYVYMGKKPIVKQIPISSGMHTLEGQVTRMFEGENKLLYSLNIPETATATISMNDALITIKNKGDLYMAMYMTYEGARGYSSLDYISNVIMPRVPSVVLIGTTTIGSTVWTVAQSAQSEWHVGQVGDGQWLMIVENSQTLHDQIVETLDGLVTK